MPPTVTRLSSTQLAESALTHQPDCVVITGGEPAIHDLAPLTSALHAKNVPIHIETSGAFPLRGDFDWVTVSPKWQKKPLPECLQVANELKLIVEDTTSIERWMEVLGDPSAFPHIWLHPEWSKRNDSTVLATISNWVKTHHHPFRAGWQLHKNYNVDALDPRSHPQ